MTTKFYYRPTNYFQNYIKSAFIENAKKNKNVLLYMIETEATTIYRKLENLEKEAFIEIDWYYNHFIMKGVQVALQSVIPYGAWVNTDWDFEIRLMENPQTTIPISRKIYHSISEELFEYIKDMGGVFVMDWSLTIAANKDWRIQLRFVNNSLSVAYEGAFPREDGIIWIGHYGLGINK